MNKTAIKNFAIWARVQLIEAAKQRAYEYEITDSGENKSGLETIGGRLLSKTEKEQRSQLLAEINRKGFSQVMEEAAYTWFNRFIALRFMEVNGYLPSKVRVFTDENGTFKPEILKQAISLDIEGLDRNKVLDLLDKQDNEELFKYLLITQCNALNIGLPYMFEKIGGWTELLFPANLLRQDSVIGQMITEISEEDWTDAVQIIGWLYQYYNSELKDETFGLLKKNIKITKERIPAATQLFTPDWIVRYMVENSLGRLWCEGHPDFDKSQWKYYLDEAEQDPEVEAQLQKIRAEYSTIKLEEIKVIDPCMGSGHILVYAFDVLMQIYTSAGWSERDAAKSILENNLYGLDIDDRAGQLAYFAVMMKARKHSRRILNGEVKPNVLSIQDSNWMTNEFIAYVAGKDATMKTDLVMLQKTFRDAKEFGSILNVPCMQYDALYERIDSINRSYAEDLFQAQYRTMATGYLLPLVRQSQIMSQKYDVVVTNPPYMGNGGMSDELGNFVKSSYPNSKSDLSTVFMEKTSQMCTNNGYYSMINIPVWMNNSNFRALREQIVFRSTIINLVHNGRGIFGSDFGSTAFVFFNRSIPEYKGKYIKLFEKAGEVSTVEQLEQRFLEKEKAFHVRMCDLRLIPGTPFAYALPEKLIKLFSGKKVSDYCDQKMRISTGDNDRFIRLWFEVSKKKLLHPNKWVMFSKGGNYRRWYGNHDYVINYDNNGAELKRFKGFSGGSDEYYFKPGIVWTDVSISKSSFRDLPPGAIACSAGPMLYVENDNIKKYLEAFLNSSVANEYMKVLCISVHFQWGDIAKIPLLFIEDQASTVSSITESCIGLSKTDWDAFETSWDFKKHPLV